MIKSQDILVLLKMIALGQEKWSYISLSESLGMSTSQLHSAVKRIQKSHLAHLDWDNGRVVPSITQLKEFLVHGLKYILVAERGGMTLGMPTIYAAAPMLDKVIASSSEPIPVWPDPEGSIRGVEFSPIHKFAPGAAKKDKKLYELLVLVDCIRGGGVREKSIAIQEIEKRLDQYYDA